MKQKTVKKWIVLLIALCAIALLSAFLLNKNFFTTNAFAEENSEAAIEDLLTFNLSNNNTEYKVKAKNKQIANVNIPTKYKGLPVTEIVDNGFASCANLTRVRVPYTVKRIGNNAFANCKNLEEINGMSRVEYIGNNAFAMCTKLDNLILPTTINSLGSTILRNNSNTIYSRMAETEMTALNANWQANSNVVTIYGNELVLTKVLNEDNGEVRGYTIRLEQNLTTDVDFVLGDTYEGKELLGIENGAFMWSSFESFTLAHGEIVLDADESNKLTTPYNLEPNSACNHTVNIGSEAFAFMETNRIDLLVDVTFVESSSDNGDVPSVGVFSDSYARQITLPNNIDCIPQSTFLNCGELTQIKNVDTNVETNQLSREIKTIGDNAFDGCSALKYLYIPDSVTTMGECVFNQWGNEIEQTLFFENLYEAPVGEIGYDWANLWNDGIGENAKLEFIKISVTLDKQGGNPNIGENSVTVMYDQDMPEATAPKNGDYIFDGYYSESNGVGTKYYDKDMNSVTPWDQKSPTATIYAKWADAPSKSHIIFYKDGGSGGSDSVDATYGLRMPDAYKPTRTGYTFAGYFSATGTMYYDAEMNSAHDWDISENTVILSAHWQNNEYQVKLDPVGGSGGDTEISVFFGVKSDAKFSAPQLKGYTFDGYNTEKGGGGTKYFGADTLGAREWDIDIPKGEEFTLYAHWTPTSYTIIFDKNGGTGGASSVNNCLYNEEMPALASDKAPTRRLYEFVGYFTKIQGDESAIRYYNSDMASAHSLQYVEFADEDNNITLYAHWKAIQYDVVYVVDNLSLPANVVNNNLKKVSIEDFNENISLPIYSVDNHGYSIKWKKSEITKDMLGNEIVIHGTATANVYTITFNLNGGLDNGGNDPNFTVAKHYVLKDATSATEGLYFDAWKLSGTNRILTNLDGIYEDITLEATWSEFKTIRITNDNLSQLLPEIEITEPKASIIFTTSFTNNLTIKVSAVTTLLGINGNGRAYNLNINVQNRNSDFGLLLYAIGINAHSGKNAIYMPTNTLHLYTNSGVSIKGCTTGMHFNRTMASGVPAINCNALFIRSSDSLWIQGGSGINGYNGSSDITIGYSGWNGGDGAPAIIAATEVRIGCDKVFIAAGLAGKGGNALSNYYYKGKGGMGAMPIAGRVSLDGISNPRIYLLSGAEEIYLYKTNDGIDGVIGKEPSSTTNPPVNPNPPASGGDLYIPPIDWDINFPPVGGNYPIPTPPIPPYTDH